MENNKYSEAELTLIVDLKDTRKLSPHLSYDIFSTVYERSYSSFFKRWKRLDNPNYGRIPTIVKNKAKPKQTVIYTSPIEVYFDNSSEHMNVIFQNAKELIKDRLCERDYRVGELSGMTGLSKENIVKIIDTLRNKEKFPVDIDEEGVVFQVTRSQGKKAVSQISCKEIYRNRVRIGVISDTHLGSIYQQLSLLHSAYEDFETNNVDFAVCVGDVSDGAPNMHKGMIHEQFIYTYSEIIDYITDVFPKSNKFSTYITPGNHDLSWVKNDSGNVVLDLIKRRSDMIYIDPFDKTIQGKNGEIILSLVHPSCGMSYALSYRVQKILDTILHEALSNFHYNSLGNSEFVKKIPHAVLVGHLHSFCYLIKGGVSGMLVPSLQSTSGYLASKGLSSTVGWMIVDFQFDERGHIFKVTPSFTDMTSFIKKRDY